MTSTKRFFSFLYKRRWDFIYRRSFRNRLENIAWYTFVATNWVFMGAIITRSQLPKYWPRKVQRRQKEREEKQRQYRAKEDLRMWKQLEDAPLGSFGRLPSGVRSAADQRNRAKHDLRISKQLESAPLGSFGGLWEADRPSGARSDLD